jgi:hypothetical protein
MESDDEVTLGSQYGPDERIKRVLKILRDGRLSILDFLLRVLQSDKPEFTTHRDRFFANPSGKLTKFMDHMLDDRRGRVALSSWFEQRAIGVISDKVTKEMDEVKTALAWTINNTTPEALLTWDIDGFISPLVNAKAPTLGSILQVAAQTKRAKENNKIKSCTTVCMSTTCRFKDTMILEGV